MAPESSAGASPGHGADDRFGFRAVDTAQASAGAGTWRRAGILRVAAAVIRCCGNICSGCSAPPRGCKTSFFLQQAGNCIDPDSGISPASAGRLSLDCHGIIVMGFISFGLWVHHMFTVGDTAVGAGVLLRWPSMLVAIPHGHPDICLLATLWTGKVIFRLPMLWNASFLIVFVCGGLTRGHAGAGAL